MENSWKSDLNKKPSGMYVMGWMGYYFADPRARQGTNIARSGRPIEVIQGEARAESISH